MTPPDISSNAAKRCGAEAWYYLPKVRAPKTLRCKQPEGHLGAHMAKDRQIGDLVWERDAVSLNRTPNAAKDET